jgi:hypothetical protein
LILLCTSQPIGRGTDRKRERKKGREREREEGRERSRKGEEGWGDVAREEPGQSRDGAVPAVVKASPVEARCWPTCGALGACARLPLPRRADVQTRMEWEAVHASEDATDGYPETRRARVRVQMGGAWETDGHDRRTGETGGETEVETDVKLRFLRRRGSAAGQNSSLAYLASWDKI